MSAVDVAVILAGTVAIGTGWLALSHRTADMNSLITVGSSAAFGDSLVVTALPGLLPADLRQGYFERWGMIITLILLGRLIPASQAAVSSGSTEPPTTSAATAAESSSGRNARRRGARDERTRRPGQ